jgi:RNA polymerase sigma-32 factor
MAKRLRGYGVPADELMAEGNVGLLRALEKFDLRGVRFKTYATYWVRAQMLACAQRQTSIVTAATGALGAKFFFKLRSARAKAETQFGSNAEVVNAYLAQQFGVSEEVIRMHSARLSSSDASLDAPLGEDGDFTALDVLACRLAGPEERFGAQERDALVQDALQRVWPALDAREKALVTERLMRDDDQMTLSDIGARFKLSRERLRQIEQRLKERFRRAFSDQGLEAQVH